MNFKEVVCRSKSNGIQTFNECRLNQPHKWEYTKTWTYVWTIYAWFDNEAGNNVSCSAAALQLKRPSSAPTF